MKEKEIIPRIVYLLTRFSLKRCEIFDGRTDVEKKPEIPRDTAKMPEIPAQGGPRKIWEQITDEKENKRHHGKGH